MTTLICTRLYLLRMIVKRWGALMKRMVEYVDRGAQPHSRHSYYSNDNIVLCISNRTAVVCTLLIKQQQRVTVTGHLLNIKWLSCTCIETQIWKHLRITFRDRMAAAAPTQHLLNTCRNSDCTHLGSLGETCFFPPSSITALLLGKWEISLLAVKAKARSETRRTL